MASQALTEWRTVGRARLAELERVHVQATGSGRGRRWGTRQLNQSLFVSLVAQFQSYCRALHDEAVSVHVSNATAGQQTLLRALLTKGRMLDTRNPTKSALGGDFGRLGFSFIDDLKARGALTEARLDKLEVVINFRNAVGHGDEIKTDALEAQGTIASTKRSYHAYRGSLNGLAGTMDDVVAEQLSQILGVARPW